MTTTNDPFWQSTDFWEDAQLLLACLSPAMVVVVMTLGMLPDSELPVLPTLGGLLSAILGLLLFFECLRVRQNKQDDHET